MHVIIMRRLINQIKHPPDKNLQFSDSYYSQLTKKTVYNMLNICKITTGNADEIEKNIFKKKFPVNIVEKLTSYNVDLNKLPRDCFSRKRDPLFLYLLNKEGAKRYASIITQDLLMNNVPVLEIFPGLGFLTEELLEAGVPQIFVYEKSMKFIKVIENLMIKYPDRLDLREYNLLNLHQLVYFDLKNGSNKFQNIFRGVKRKSDDDKLTMQLIGVMPNTALLTFFSSPFPHGYFKFDHIVLYVIIFPSTLRIFEDIPDNIFHTPRNIYLRNKFDYKFLDEFPREYFFPYSPKTLKRKRNIQYYVDDLKKMYLVKIESKKNALTNDFTQLDWYYFLNFLRLSMTRRTARIIPTLEKWIPGCGPSLIKYNFDIYSRFSSLNSSELLDLYKIFRDMPEFKTSSFVSILQSRVSNYIEINPAT